MGRAAEPPRNPDATRCGVLLVNIGSPEAATAAAVWRYLRQFLSDRRVVDAPRLLWVPLLYLVILPLRAPRSARLYRRIWTEEGSPLLAVSARQQVLLARALRRRTGSKLPVAIAMRYGEPGIAQGLGQLCDAGCARLIVLPLFPQHSGTTTGSAFDAVARALGSSRRIPDLRLITGYHDHPAYIRALAASVRDYWSRHGQADRLLVSFHGLPRRYADAGDPYPDQCTTTARLLATELDLVDGSWSQAYQSRFGREEWLRPYTDEELTRLGHDGLDSVDVICPGFAADCLETLEEVAIGLRETFKDAGGRQLRYIPALNERAEHIEALAEIVLDYV